MRFILMAASVAVIGACSPDAAETSTESTPSAAAAIPEPAAVEIPAGVYKLDPAHSTLVFTVSHLGFSNYTARFDRFDAELQLDPANPGATKLTASIDPNSLGIPSPPEGFLDTLKGSDWLNIADFPVLSFSSTSVEPTGPNTATITGDLTLHGVTKPISLEATFNGGYAGHAYEPNARAGFSAHGVFKRSDFGISIGIPQPGSNMGVGDDVEVRIETEFTGPPLADAPPAPAN